MTIGILFVIPDAFSQVADSALKADSLYFPSCKDGQKLAKTDFGNGIYKVYSFGFTVETKVGFADFYRKYMMKKYSVDFSHQGCVVFEDKKCYSDAMKDLLRGKYGSDFFEKNLRDAEVLFARRSKAKK
ncbi:hypothetical protein [Flavobacterium sp.]|uniref:hypothetical protein n=1 Tax=Flavobacterium sp. TaxID=239 RepID=UPI0011FCAA0D|nr:hypothetical protein [Flavobacterium sp.]RZJ71817.1 MAG: hypothetical protein EOO49_09125 [Flavobacterium sp.]